MKRTEEWDWPPIRGRRYRWPPTRSRFDVYQSGWNSPGTKKAVHIYWQVTITIIKMLLAIPLSAMVVGSIWMIWILLTL
jgi:hypothetical protein